MCKLEENPCRSRYLFFFVPFGSSMPIHATGSAGMSSPKRGGKQSNNACDYGHANDVTADTPRLVSEAREISVQTASLALGASTNRRTPLEQSPQRA